MKFAFIGVVSMIVLNAPADARAAGGLASSAGGHSSSGAAACEQGVINPWPQNLMHRTTYVGDTVVGTAPNSCCRATCTQMLSTTRLEPARKPART